MKFIIIISLLTAFLYAKSQDSDKLDLIDSLLTEKQYSQAIIVAKDISKLDDIYDKMKFNGLLTTAYLGLNQTKKATYYANKVFRVPNIIAGYARTRKTLVCSEITNYYVNNKNWKQAVKWKKKRLYMYNMEVCENGKYRRNMILYENIIDIYKKLNNIKLVKKYESKLEKYKNNESSQSKLY